MFVARIRGGGLAVSLFVIGLSAGLTLAEDAWGRVKNGPKTVGDSSVSANVLKPKPKPTLAPPLVACRKTSDFDGNGGVDGGDLSLLLSAWNSDSAQFDLNTDKVVNGADLSLLLAEWGPAVGCRADLDRNCTVDSADLGLVLTAWSSSVGSDEPADLNGDKAVNGLDLGIVQAAFGACPGSHTSQDDKNAAAAFENVSAEAMMNRAE